MDPQGWLADTLARIPDYKITRVDDLLPWNWSNHATWPDAYVYPTRSRRWARPRPAASVSKAAPGESR